MPVKQIAQDKQSLISAPLILICIMAVLLTSCSRAPELDQTIESVDAQLDQLPRLQPNMLCPTIGFGSAIFPKPDHSSWLDIILSEPRQIDTVVLIPALLRNKSGELETLGFPHRFTIEAWRGVTAENQSVQLENGGWLYQSVGHYDSNTHTNELVCDLTLNQSLNGASAAPVSVSLHYSSNFEPADGLDVHDAPGTVQVGQAITLQPWAEWAAQTDQQGPRVVRSRFDLSSVPDGTTLYLRIANNTAKKDATIDEVHVNPPFSLINGAFSTPVIPNQGVYHDITDWYDSTEEWFATQQSRFQSGSNYQNGGVTVDYSEIDFPNPGTAPVVFKLPPNTIAEKVRIRSIRMQEEASWRKEQGHNFAINEVLLFDGNENVALNSLTASSDNENFPLMFDSNYAVDGYNYFPPVDPKEVSRPHGELIEEDDESLKLLFDLGKKRKLDQISFYPVDRSPQFSHIYAMGIGFPRKITVYVGDDSDLHAASTTIHINTQHQIGASPLMSRLPKVSGRYIWIEMNEGHRDPRTGKNALGFSEIELFEDGTNILSGLQPRHPNGHSYQHLTDGRTSSGIIIQEKKWLLDLARRAELEREKEGLAQRREHIAQRQNRLVALLQGAMLFFLIAALITTLVTRSRHRQHLRELREKIGANLHDEVGANLSSIALSSELLEHSYDLDKSRAHRLIDDINRIARETATEIRLLSRFLERQDVESNLIGQLRRIEQQMLPSLKTLTNYGAPEQFNALAPTEKWELVLFFKEALHNIVKHSGASQVTIQTSAEGRQRQLEISDNGRGFDDGNPPPTHLAKRAKKLRAHLEINSSGTTGTSIRLTIPTKRIRRK